MAAVGIGIMGCGAAAGIHLERLLGCPDVDLAGCADGDLATALDFAAVTRGMRMNFSRQDSLSSSPIGFAEYSESREPGMTKTKTTTTNLCLDIID